MVEGKPKKTQEQGHSQSQKQSQDNDTKDASLPTTSSLTKVEKIVDKDNNVRIRRKPPAIRHKNSEERQKQIKNYNTLLSKEDREKRIRKRKSLTNEDLASINISSQQEETPSPKKKKRVSFEF